MLPAVPPPASLLNQISSPEVVQPCVAATAGTDAQARTAAAASSVAPVATRVLNHLSWGCLRACFIGRDRPFLAGLAPPTAAGQNRRCELMGENHRYEHMFNSGGRTDDSTAKRSRSANPRPRFLGARFTPQQNRGASRDRTGGLLLAERRESCSVPRVLAGVAEQVRPLARIRPEIADCVRAMQARGRHDRSAQRLCPVRG